MYKRQVVEGVGDHGCEYMTGGRVAVLGKTGKNFAAGMSGGVAYVLDEDNDLYLSVNKQLVNIEHVTAKMDVEELKTMIEEHVAYTNSEIGKKILEHFTDYLPKFKKIIPADYEKMMTTILQLEEQGMSSEQAKIEEMCIRDRYITVRIQVPKNLSEDAKRKLKAFEEACEKKGRGAA